MPLDVDLAKNLASMIDAETFILSKKTIFTFDRLGDDERVSELTVRLSIDSLERDRTDRGRWQHKAIIQLVILAPQQIRDEAKLINHLDFLDGVLGFVEQAAPDGRIAMGFESLQDERFDFDKYQNDGQFRSGVLVQYNLISGK